MEKMVNAGNEFRIGDGDKNKIYTKTAFGGGDTWNPNPGYVNYSVTELPYPAGKDTTTNQEIVVTLQTKKGKEEK